MGPAPPTSELGTAAVYETKPPAGAAFRGPLAGQVQTGVGRARAEGADQLIADPRLGALGSWTAKFWAVHGRFPAAEAIDYEAHRIGLVEPVPSIGLMGTEIDGELPNRVAEQVDQMMARGQYTHVGAATETSGNRARIVLVLSTRPLHLEPIPSSPPIEAPIYLRGALTDGYRKPELVVVTPEGQSSRRTLSDGAQIDARIDTPRVGQYQVELLADGPHGITVVANFPVYSGIRRRPAPPPLPAADDAKGSAADMRRAMLALINDTRRQANLPALKLSEELNAIAAAHNRDMRDSGYVGHTSPTTGKPEDRVRAAGIVAPIVAENVGRGYGLSEIHRGLLGSPGHRDNLLHPHVTDVGIDVLPSDPEAKQEFLVTEVFTRVIPPLHDGDGDPVARVIALIAAARKAAGVPPLETDPALAELAQHAAGRHFTQPELSPEANMAALKKERHGLPLPYTGLSQTLTVVSVLEDIATLDSLLDPRARAIGIGLAQGTRPDTVPNAIVGVLLIGY